MMLLRTCGRAALAAALLAAGACGAGAAGDGPSAADGGAAVFAEEAWARASLPPHDAASAYLTLRNPGAEDAVLVGAECAVAAVAELHVMEVDDATQRMRMRATDAMTVPAGGRLVLEPGSDHLMFFELASPWEAGEEVAISLRFADGSALELGAVPVRAPTSR